MATNECGRMNPIRKYYRILRLLGPRVVALRCGMFARDKLGITRRVFRPCPWETIDLARITTPGTPTDPESYAAQKLDSSPPFLFPLGRPPDIPNKILNAGDGRTIPLIERLALLQEDRCMYFFDQPSPEPIDWHRNPFENTRSDPDRVWCDLPFFSPEQGDVRTMWEPARAAWAIDIARARAQQLDLQTAKLFQRWMDSWLDANPPFSGIHWKCGQESAVRFIAMAIGFWSCASDEETTPERWVNFARLAWATGYRIERHIKYAVSQKNNHALSEACGLIVIGHLFPEFRASQDWQHKGRTILERELRRQLYEDGSYLQHSMNYHRVMLHVSMLAMRLAELTERPFPDDIYERIGRCGEFLFQMMDQQSGRVPNYGHNDGALVLPLSECDATDFRPVVQATHYLVKRKRLLPLGAWDEDLIWLFGEDAAASDFDEPREPESSAFEVGGYYTLRRPNSWAMIRCHTYRDRPSQCDPLQVDLWWHGQNILRDCGTFRYYDARRPGRERYFKSIAAHNTVEIDGAEPMALVSRFLWHPWLKATAQHFQPRGAAAILFEGRNESYDRPPTSVLHRRAVISLPSDVWLIVDDLLGNGRHTATLRWHLLNVPFEIDPETRSVTLSTPRDEVTIGLTGHPISPERFEVVWGRDTDRAVQGFASPYYGRCEAIPTIELDVSFINTQRLITVFSPGKTAGASLGGVIDDYQSWEITGDNEKWTVDLAKPSRSADRILLDPHGNPAESGL